MTVSRALRNDPCVRPEQRERIRRIAKTIGYEPDASLGRYLSLAKQKRSQESGSTIALLRCLNVQKEADRLTRYMPVAILEETARRLRFKIDDFSVEDSPASVERTRRILEARGIRAILLLPCAGKHAIASFNFGGFVVASIGYGLGNPHLNGVGTDIMDGFRRMLIEYRQRGIRRIGLAVTPFMDSRTNHGFSGALLSFQSGIPAAEKVTPFWVDDSDPGRQRAEFVRWLKKQKPEVVVGPDEILHDWIDSADLEGQAKPLVFSSDWNRHTSRGPGLDHRRDLVCHYAIEMITNGIVTNQTGIPENSFRMLVSAELVEGNPVNAFAPLFS